MNDYRYTSEIHNNYSYIIDPLVFLYLHISFVSHVIFLVYINIKSNHIQVTIFFKRCPLLATSNHMNQGHSIWRINDHQICKCSFDLSQESINFRLEARTSHSMSRISSTECHQLPSRSISEYRLFEYLSSCDRWKLLTYQIRSLLICFEGSALDFFFCKFIIYHCEFTIYHYLDTKQFHIIPWCSNFPSWSVKWC